MAEFVDSTVKEIDARLAQLQDEVNKLQAARAALVGTRRGPGRPRTSGGGAATSTRTTTRRRGRPRGRRSGGGTRAAQALALVRSRPGVTIPEIAKELKIQPNYLYRVMPGLEQEGSITRQGKGYHPAA